MKVSAKNNYTCNCAGPVLPFLTLILSLWIFPAFPTFFCLYLMTKVVEAGALSWKNDLILAPLSPWSASTNYPNGTAAVLPWCSSLWDLSLSWKLPVSSRTWMSIKSHYIELQQYILHPKMIFLLLFIKIFLLFCHYIVIAFLIALLLSSYIKPVTAYLGVSAGKFNMALHVSSFPPQCQECQLHQSDTKERILHGAGYQL